MFGIAVIPSANTLPSSTVKDAVPVPATGTVPTAQVTAPPDALQPIPETKVELPGTESAMVRPVMSALPRLGQLKEKVSVPPGTAGSLADLAQVTSGSAWTTVFTSLLSTATVPAVVLVMVE